MIKQFIKKNFMFISYSFAFIIVCIVTSFVFIYITASLNTMVDNIRYRLMAVSKLAAQFVTAEELDQYQTVADMKLPSYQELRYKLRDFALENDVLYVYYERPVGNKLQYIIDNDFDMETRVGLDTPPYAYLHNYAWILQVLEDGLTLCSDYQHYKDGWEGLMRAYSPVFNKDGKITAIAGVDIDDAPIVQARWIIFFPDNITGRYSDYSIYFQLNRDFEFKKGSDKSQRREYSQKQFSFPNEP